MTGFVYMSDLDLLREAAAALSQDHYTLDLLDAGDDPNCPGCVVITKLCERLEIKHEDL